MAKNQTISRYSIPSNWPLFPCRQSKTHLCLNPPTRLGNLSLILYVQYVYHSQRTQIAWSTSNNSGWLTRPWDIEYGHVYQWWWDDKEVLLLALWSLCIPDDNMVASFYSCLFSPSGKISGKIRVKIRILTLKPFYWLLEKRNMALDKIYK